MSEYIETHLFDETAHEPKSGSFENVEISHNNNTWRVTGMLGFFGWAFGEPLVWL